MFDLDQIESARPYTRAAALPINVRFTPKSGHCVSGSGCPLCAVSVPRSLLCVPRENVIPCRRYRMTRGPHALVSLKLGLNVSDVASFRKGLGCGVSLIVCRSIDMERFQQSPTDHPTAVFLLLSQA